MNRAGRGLGAGRELGAFGMLMGRLGRVLRRRWYVVLAGLVLTGALAAALVVTRPPGYSVTVTALLLPPGQTADGTEVNPYLQLGGLTSATDVLARALNDPSVHDEVVTGTEGDFTAGRDFLTSAPILLVTAEAPTADEAQRIGETVLGVAPQVLSRLQSEVGVPASSQLTVERIVDEAEPEVQYKSLVRILLVLVGGGLGATLLLAGAVDAWSAHRVRKRGSAAVPDGRPETVPEVAGAVGVDVAGGESRGAEGVREAATAHRGGDADR